MPRSAPRLLVGLLLAASLCGLSRAQPIAPDTGGIRTGERESPPSQQEADKLLQQFQPQWTAAAQRYEHYALRFLCNETHRTVDYSRSAGEARKEKEVPYGYLLVLDPKGPGYEVIRQTLDAEGRPTGSERTLDLPCPEPYAWALLFMPTTASTFRFRYLGREIQSYRLTHVVGFEGSAPRLEGKDVREWSGTAWIEDRTGSLVRVEARPNFQNERMLALWRDFQQAFTYPLGIKGKPRPHGYAMAVAFDFERDGLLFPTRLDLSDFTWVATYREVMDTRLVLTYDDYRFFRTETEERLNQPESGAR